MGVGVVLGKGVGVGFGKGVEVWAWALAKVWAKAWAWAWAKAWAWAWAKAKAWALSCEKSCCDVICDYSATAAAYVFSATLLPRQANIYKSFYFSKLCNPQLCCLA